MGEHILLEKHDKLLVSDIMIVNIEKQRTSKWGYIRNCVYCEGVKIAMSVRLRILRVHAYFKNNSHLTFSAIYGFLWLVMSKICLLVVCFLLRDILHVAVFKAICTGLMAALGIQKQFRIEVTFFPLVRGYGNFTAVGNVVESY